MTEIVARLPRPRGLVRAAQGVAALAGVALVLVGVVALRPHAAAHLTGRVVSSPGEKRGGAARIATARVSTTLGRDASLGFERSFFTSSPGGVVASAARVARWHSLAVRASRGTGLAPALLEGLVFVKSSGRADVTGGTRAGLTQLAPREARRLGLRVNTAKSRTLTRRIARTSNPRRVRQLRRWRSRYDERFSPAKELHATVRFLVHARRVLGRDDLAIAAYRLGVGNLRRTIAMYGDVESVPSFAQLYFGSSPDRRPAIWRRLGTGGDYYWKVLAAEQVLRLYHHGALSYEATLQAKKNSAEEALHPRSLTPRFRTPAAIAKAWRRHVLRAIPRDAARAHLVLDQSLGQEAHALGRSRRLYTGLRPQALAVLLYMGRRVHRLSGAPRLVVTSAVRDNRYQRVLTHVNVNAARAYSLHTTGYAFDIARSYSSPRQAAAFQFVLDRLEAVNAIAYIREAAAIHVAVASDAVAKLELLARA